jgi:hypothetical protein
MAAVPTMTAPEVQCAAESRLEYRP